MCKKTFLEGGSLILTCFLVLVNCNANAEVKMGPYKQPLTISPKDVSKGETNVPSITYKIREDSSDSELFLFQFFIDGEALPVYVNFSIFEDGQLVASSLMKESNEKKGTHEYAFTIRKNLLDASQLDFFFKDSSFRLYLKDFRSGVSIKE